MSDTEAQWITAPDRRASITISYDPDDRIEAAQAAAIVRGDTERLRGVLRDVRERVNQVARGKYELPRLSAYGASIVLDWIYDELDGLPLSLDE